MIREYYFIARKSWDKRIILRQAFAVVFVSELSDDADVAGGIGDGNGGEADAVEGIVFDHGVMGHILKDQFGADLEGFGEGIIADDIAGQAG